MVLSNIAENILFQENADFRVATHCAARFSIELPPGSWAYILGFDFFGRDNANTNDYYNPFSIIMSTEGKTKAWQHRAPTTRRTSSTSVPGQLHAGFKYPVYTVTNDNIGFTIFESFGFDPINERIGNVNFQRLKPFTYTSGNNMDVNQDELLRYQFSAFDNGQQVYYQPFGTSFTRDLLGLAPTGRPENPNWMLGSQGNSAIGVNSRLAAPYPATPQSWLDFPGVNVYYILINGQKPSDFKKYTRKLLGYE